jgi:hypothetical protein
VLIPGLAFAILELLSGPDRGAVLDGVGDGRVKALYRKM